MLVSAMFVRFLRTYGILRFDHTLFVVKLVNETRKCNEIKDYWSNGFIVGRETWKSANPCKTAQSGDKIRCQFFRCFKKYAIFGQSDAKYRLSLLSKLMSIDVNISTFSVPEVYPRFISCFRPFQPRAGIHKNNTSIINDHLFGRSGIIKYKM